MRNESQFKRAKFGIKCRLCHKDGHNKAKCKMPTPSTHPTLPITSTHPTPTTTSTQPTPTATSTRPTLHVAST